MDHLDTAAVDETLDTIEGTAHTPPAPSAYEVKSHHGDLSRTHAAFREANDERLAQLRTRGAADPVTVEKVERLNAELDRLTHEGAPEHKALRRPGRRPESRSGGDTAVREAVIAMGREVLRQGQVIDRAARGLPAGSGKAVKVFEAARQAEVKRNRPPGLASRYPGMMGSARGAARRPGAEAAYKAGIIHWMRTGEDTHRGLHLKTLYSAAYAIKGLHSELNPQGGYLVHPERRGGSPLEAAMAELTPMRRLATVYTLTEGDSFQIPQNVKGTAAGWVGERESRPETAAPELAMTDIPAMELYAMPVVTQRLLDHVDFDAEAWLTQEVAEAMALQEGPAYITGDGMKKPRGLLTYEFVTDHSLWAHGSFRLVETGADGAFLPMAPTGSPPTHPGHALIDTQYALKTAHRPNASWLMERTTAAAIRKLTDERGNYLWQPGIAAGQPPTILQSPVEEEPNMPALGLDTVSIGYGAWAKVYCIVEKGGVRMLRDPYSQKGHVLFYTTKLVGGGVQNFDAAIFLRFSAPE